MDLEENPASEHNKKLKQLHGNVNKNMTAKGECVGEGERIKAINAKRANRDKVKEGRTYD